MTVPYPAPAYLRENDSQLNLSEESIIMVQSANIYIETSVCGSLRPSLGPPQSATEI